MWKVNFPRLKVLRKTLYLILAGLIVTGCPKASIDLASNQGQKLPAALNVIGHRGAAGLAPENTLASFSQAMDHGVDAVELDVLLSADGEVVVHHDFSLKPEIARAPDGRWIENRPTRAVKDLTLAELRAYDVGKLKPGTAYAGRYPNQKAVEGQRIPTLKEVIALIKANPAESIEIWVEIKTSPKKPGMTPSPETVADAVLAVLKAEDFTARARILSFDWRALKHVQTMASDIPTVYLTSGSRQFTHVTTAAGKAFLWTAGLDLKRFEGSIPRMVAAAGGRYWGPRHDLVTPMAVAEAHRLGIEIFVWTPDARSDMLRLIQMNVDGIITNRPDILKDLLEQKPAQAAA